MASLPKSRRQTRTFVFSGLIRRGGTRALCSGMAGAKQLEELIVWQLACELRDGIAAAVSKGSAQIDWDFRNQIERSSRSVAANIAEGYGHFRPRQFAKYLRIARASTMETRNHVIEGRVKHFSSEDSARFLRLCKRIIPGTSSLIEYLDSCDPDLNLRPDKREPSNPEPLNPEPFEP
jgi:four helix bundle protein